MQKPYYAGEGAWWYMKAPGRSSLRTVLSCLVLFAMYAVVITQSPAPVLIFGPKYIHPTVLVVTSPPSHPTYALQANLDLGLSLQGLDVTLSQLFLIPNETAITIVVRRSPHPSVQQSTAYDAWFSNHPNHFTVEDNAGNVAKIAKWVQSYPNGKDHSEVVYVCLLSGLSKFTDHITIHFQKDAADLSFSMDVHSTAIADFELPRIMQMSQP